MQSDGSLGYNIAVLDKLYLVLSLVNHSHVKLDGGESSGHQFWGCLRQWDKSR